MIRAYNLGRRNYREVLSIQRNLLESKKNGYLKDDILILVEHNPVITIGKSGDRNDVLVTDDFLKKNCIDILEVERGGKVTYHGPGQLIVYPIFDLSRFGKDIHKIIRQYEETIIYFLKNYDINGERIENFTGVWVNAKKIASIGITIRSWITFHGISINIYSESIKNFSLINPCGLSSESMTSISNILNIPDKQIDLNDACARLINSFEKVFGSDIIYETDEISKLVKEKNPCIK